MKKLATIIAMLVLALTACTSQESKQRNGVPPMTTEEKSVKLKELAGETFIMLSELGFWSNAVKHAIPDAKFIEQDDITDLRDIIAHSTLPAFATDYTEQADHLPVLKKTSRV